jgi:tRNA A37 threonylcarbamoyladenosine synthetase subunit TsaC/SUA5/YrdC
MDLDHDFSQLRALLASRAADLPADTQVEQFLTEFHHRQRAQLLVPQSLFARTFSRLKEMAAGFELAPSLSYASVVAAIALVAFAGLSQQVEVTHVDGQSKLAFRMPGHDSSFALVPASLVAAPALSAKVSDSPSFAPSRSDSATRYVLANNTPGANDTTVAF